MVDATGGAAARLIARSATGPFWSSDGTTVFFQRNGGEFVERRLADGAERVLFRAGEPPVPRGRPAAVPGLRRGDGAPGRDPARARGAADHRALRAPGSRSGNSAAPATARSPGRRDRRSVFFVGHGGRQQNALYTLVPGGRAELWLDLPGELSHEYFPRQSADGRFLVFAASAGGREHEHDAGDYELFLWRVGDPGRKSCPADVSHRQRQLAGSLPVPRVIPGAGSRGNSCGTVRPEVAK